ncbi:ParB/RepB/Spo0J family partition protein [Piscirickettsia litoralis]|uniref:ParB-like N-terminal domain-containing protein n=1 Tax=Piscirickettsia litoralis TaxID=1891921 RepID=A0ABX3A690_9GAMM|nr:ParB/RepB/Spo0J family partition protein [Piscirickettsia litoralis]ODN41624.1 hypothetical protein BGC07_16150 [Piscirickettsia litoralis]
MTNTTVQLKGFGIINKKKQSSVSIFTVKICDIHFDPSQPRKYFDQNKLKSLSKSIKDKGVIQPVVLNKLRSGQYLLVAGERRVRASKLAGLETIPAVVKEEGEQSAYELAVIENIQREDLNPLEEALSYQRLKQEFGMSITEISHLAGKSRPYISNYIRILNTDDQSKQLLIDGKIDVGHIKATLRLKDSKEEQKLLLQAALKGQTVRTVEKNVENILKGKNKENNTDAQPIKKNHF